jgi:two-component system cell cycle response regulator
MYGSPTVKVLVVDDSAIERMVLSSAIEHLGHNSIEVASSADAWQALAREQFDVVLTDWLMPGGSGPELCQRIRERIDQPYVYVVLCTALGDRDHGLEGVRAGADTFLTKPIDSVALDMCLIAAERLMAVHRQLASKNVDLTLRNGTLEELTRTDPLTGLGNRHQLQEDLPRLAALAARYNQPFSAAMCDVDRFKLYNDRFGHLAGDEALRTVGRALALTCRASDTVYRYGGEELLVLFSQQSARAAGIAGARLRKAVEATQIPHPDNQPFGMVTISVGVASLDDIDPAHPKELLRRADQALYEAKHAGRNQVSLYRHHVMTG